jgi:endonuclease YncB( thermonuclease family)
VKIFCKKLAVFVVGASLIGGAPAATAASNVAKIVDGDTITMSNGEKVRLIQIDTPELGSNECYAEQSRSELSKLLNQPGKLSLKSDSKLDATDKYGRSLRYVFIGRTNINLKMIEIGAAAPYFYQGGLGVYSKQFLKAAENAKKKVLGLWNLCPGSKLNPYSALQTDAFKSNPSAAATSNTTCDANYAGCVPAYPPDLDCGDIKRLNLAPVKVNGRDLHKLDSDGDGIGCDK